MQPLYTASLLVCYGVFFIAESFSMHTIKILFFIDKYVEIEKSLVTKFKEAHISADIPRMKIYATALQQFTQVGIGQV